MSAAYEEIETWSEIRQKLNYEIVRQVSTLVGSGTKTTGVRRFFSWLTMSEHDDAKWMVEYLANDNRDLSDTGLVRRVHRSIGTWQQEMLAMGSWKSSSVRSQREHLLIAMEMLRNIDDDSFPLIDRKLIPIGAHRDAQVRTGLGVLDWPEYEGVEPSRRDAVGLALVRGAALSVFERYEKIYKFGQAVLNDQSPPSKRNRPWHAVRVLIEQEVESWERDRCSMFSKEWSDRQSALVRSLASPSEWLKLGLSIDFDTDDLQHTLVADLILACVGPTYRSNQAVQTIYCCDTGWNRQPIQYLPVHPFAFRTDSQVFVGTNRVLAAFKNRAGHTVFADPRNSTPIRGLAAANYTSEWENVTAELKLEKRDEQSSLDIDSELLDILQRYQTKQHLSRAWTGEKTRDLFFHALSQRGDGLRVADRDVGPTMPPDSPLRRRKVNFSAIRKSHLNSLSTVGFEPRYIGELAGHHSARILQSNYIVGAQAQRTYEEAARFWQNCVQEIVMTGRIAFKLQIPEENREWFRTLGLLTGITAACGFTSIQLDGDVSEDDVFVPNQESFIELFIAHRGINQQRTEVPVQRWEVQGKAILAMIKGIGMQISKKSLGREYRSAARVANRMLRAGELSLPLFLEI